MLRKLFAALAVLLVLAPFLLFGLAPSASALVGCATYVHGIDVSDAQGSINWSRVSSSGINFAYIKATEGTTFVASTGARNRAGATAAGIPFGSYDFARPSGGTSAQAEANYFVDHGGADGTLPPMLDLETVGGKNPNELGAWARTWLDVVRLRTGRTPIVYTGRYFPVNAAYLLPNAIWIAGYPAGYTPDPNPCNLGLPGNLPGTNWVVWQYTSSSHVAGIGGNVDQSVANPVWFAYVTGIHTAPAPSPTPGAASWPIYSVGSRGPGVAKVQQVVGAVPDGVYGPATAAAVARFQARLGITPDGVWGTSTQQASDRLFAFLLALANVHPVANVPAPTLPRPGASWGVAALQQDLNRLGAGLAVSGVYDWATGRAVINLQRVFALRTDGVYGPATAGALALAVR